MNDKNEAEEMVIMICLFLACLFFIIPVIYFAHHYRAARLNLKIHSGINIKEAILGISLLLGSVIVTEFLYKSGTSFRAWGFDLYCFYITYALALNLGVLTLEILSKPFWMKHVIKHFNNQEKHELF